MDYRRTHLMVSSSWPFRLLPSSTRIQDSLILISSLLRTRAKDEKMWGEHNKCLSNTTESCYMERLICGLTGFGGRTKTSWWELLEGRYFFKIYF